jgi:hypothetical protein
VLGFRVSGLGFRVYLSPAPMRGNKGPSPHLQYISWHRDGCKGGEHGGVDDVAQSGAQCVAVALQLRDGRGVGGEEGDQEGVLRVKPRANLVF